MASFEDYSSVQVGPKAKITFTTQNLDFAFGSVYRIAMIMYEYERSIEVQL
ncbi:MAG: hypothetical protein WCL60_11960 [Methylococcales bacterium]